MSASADHVDEEALHEAQQFDEVASLSGLMNGAVWSSSIAGVAMMAEAEQKAGDLGLFTLLKRRNDCDELLGGSVAATLDAMRTALAQQLRAPSKTPRWSAAALERLKAAASRVLLSEARADDSLFDFDQLIEALEGGSAAELSPLAELLNKLEPLAAMLRDGSALSFASVLRLVASAASSHCRLKLRCGNDDDGAARFSSPALL